MNGGNVVITGGNGTRPGELGGTVVLQAQKPREPFTRLLITHLLAVFGWGGAYWAVNTYAPEQMPLALHCGICLLLILTAGARFAAARANLTARRALEGGERETQIRQNEYLELIGRCAQYERLVGSSEDRTNRSLARLDQRMENDATCYNNIRCETNKAIKSLEQRLDATIAKQDEIESKYLNVDRAVADLLRVKRGGGSACPEPGRGVPYAPQGACRDAADAAGAIFDALELVARGETHVPEHIEVGDKVVWLRPGLDGLTVGKVISVTRATLVVEFTDNALGDGSAVISRDQALAHCPKEA